MPLFMGLNQMKFNGGCRRGAMRRNYVGSFGVWMYIMFELVLRIQSHYFYSYTDGSIIRKQKSGKGFREGIKLMCV